MRRKREGDRSVARAELLHHQGDRQHVELGPAVFVRDGEACQTERGELGHELERELPLSLQARAFGTIRDRTKSRTVSRTRS